MKQTELQNAYSQIPQGFHNALLSAVSELKEERPVKKRHISLLVAVLIAALLCGTALAIINYYSVRDYQADGKPSAEFEKLVLEIGETYENDYITFTVGDTVFDGTGLAVTMDLFSKNESKPVFLFPTLKGYCGERQLDIDVEGMRGLDQSGFLYPNLIDGDVLDHHYGMDAALFEDTADSDVTWTFTLQVLMPNWPIQCYDVELHGDESDPSMEEYMQPFYDAYAAGKILATGGESLVEFDDVLPAPEGMTKREWYELRIPERLVKSGAFTLVDAIVCTFVTKLPEITRIPGRTFAFDDYTVELDMLTLSPMRADFSLRQCYTGKSNNSADFYYELRSQTGAAFEDMSSCGTLSDDGDCFTYVGAVRPTEDALTAVTFVPYTIFQAADGAYENLYDEAHAFTVELSAVQ